MSNATADQSNERIPKVKQPKDGLGAKTQKAVKAVRKAAAKAKNQA